MDTDKKRLKVLISEAIELALEDIDPPDVFSESDEENETGIPASKDKQEDDEDDINIEDADLGEEQENSETGEYGTSREEDETDDGERAANRKADIEFRIDNGKIIHQVNLGNLVNCPDRTIRNARLEAMNSMAEFLKINQEKFLRSPDVETAYVRMKSFRQKDFLDFHNKNHPNEIKDTGWSTRVIKNKKIQAPFSRRLIPLPDFFDELWEMIIILKTAFDYHLSYCLSVPVNFIPEIEDIFDGENGKNHAVTIESEKFPLSAQDQAKILSFFLGNPYNAHDVTQTLWKRLREFYDQEDWAKIRLIGGRGSQSHYTDAYLEEIAKHVSTTIDPPFK